MNLKLDDINVGDKILYRENKYSFYPVTVVSINKEHPAVLVSEEGSWMIFEPRDLFDERGMVKFILSDYDHTLLTN